MERTEQTTLQLNAIRLCRTWLDFLDHAGKYAARYYLARDLELPPGLQSPNTRIILARNYQTEKKLLEAIQRDLDTFPAELQDINAAQTACDLLPFSERADYLAQIVMGFAMLDHHGKERRGYYRRKVNQALKASGKGSRRRAFIPQSAGEKFSGEPTPGRNPPCQENCHCKCRRRGRLCQYLRHCCSRRLMIVFVH